MRNRQDFRQTIRSGKRLARPTLVAHLVLGEASVSGEPGVFAGTGHTSVGFVVSKAVGPAVVRNRVKRRLRHLMRDRVELLPAGSQLVIRALPESARHPASSLGVDLDAALAKCGVL